MERVGRSVKESSDPNARFDRLWDILRPDSNNSNTDKAAKRMHSLLRDINDEPTSVVVVTNQIGDQFGTIKPRARLIEVMVDNQEPVCLNDLTVAARHIRPSVMENLEALEAAILSTELQ